MDKKTEPVFKKQKLIRKPLLYPLSEGDVIRRWPIPSKPEVLSELTRLTSEIEDWLMHKPYANNLSNIRYLFTELPVFLKSNLRIPPFILTNLPWSERLHTQILDILQLDRDSIVPKSKAELIAGTSIRKKLFRAFTADLKIVQRTPHIELSWYESIGVPVTAINHIFKTALQHSTNQDTVVSHSFIKFVHTHIRVTCLYIDAVIKEIFKEIDAATEENMMNCYSNLTGDYIRNGPNLLSRSCIRGDVRAYTKQSSITYNGESTGHPDERAIILLEENMYTAAQGQIALPKLAADVMLSPSVDAMTYRPGGYNKYKPVDEYTTEDVTPSLFYEYTIVSGSYDDQTNTDRLIKEGYRAPLQSPASDILLTMKQEKGSDYTKAMNTHHRSKTIVFNNLVKLTEDKTFFNSSMTGFKTMWHKSVRQSVRSSTEELSPINNECIRAFVRTDISSKHHYTVPFDSFMFGKEVFDCIIGMDPGYSHSFKSEDDYLSAILQPRHTGYKHINELTKVLTFSGPREAEWKSEDMNVQPTWLQLLKEFPVVIDTFEGVYDFYDFCKVLALSPVAMANLLGYFKRTVGLKLREPGFFALHKLYADHYEHLLTTVYNEYTTSHYCTLQEKVQSLPISDNTIAYQLTAKVISEVKSCRFYTWMTPIPDEFTLLRLNAQVYPSILAFSEESGAVEASSTEELWHTRVKIWKQHIRNAIELDKDNINTGIWKQLYLFPAFHENIRDWQPSEFIMSTGEPCRDTNDAYSVFFTYLNWANTPETAKAKTIKTKAVALQKAFMLAANATGSSHTPTDVTIGEDMSYIRKFITKPSILIRQGALDSREESSRDYYRSFRGPSWFFRDDAAWVVRQYEGALRDMIYLSLALMQGHQIFMNTVAAPYISDLSNRYNTQKSTYTDTLVQPRPLSTFLKSLQESLLTPFQSSVLKVQNIFTVVTGQSDLSTADSLPEGRYTPLVRALQTITEAAAALKYLDSTIEKHTSGVYFSKETLEKMNILDMDGLPETELEENFNTLNLYGKSIHGVNRVNMGALYFSQIVLEYKRQYDKGIPVTSDSGWGQLYLAVVAASRNPSSMMYAEKRDLYRTIEAQHPLKDEAKWHKVEMQYHNLELKQEDSTSKNRPCTYALSPLFRRDEFPGAYCVPEHNNLILIRATSYRNAVAGILAHIPNVHVMNIFSENCREFFKIKEPYQLIHPSEMVRTFMEAYQYISPSCLAVANILYAEAKEARGIDADGPTYRDNIVYCNDPEMDMALRIIHPKIDELYSRVVAGLDGSNTAWRIFI